MSVKWHLIVPLLERGCASSQSILAGSSLHPEVCKDTSFIKTKADCVFEKLVGAKSTTIYNPTTIVGQNLKKFWRKDGFDCKFVVTDTIKNPNTNAITVYTPGSKLLVICIRKNYMETASTIRLARTLIHETIHAYIFSEIALQLYPNDCNGVTRLSPDIDFAQNWQTYEGFNPATQENQHDYMSQNYITTIKEGLKDFMTRSNIGKSFTDAELESIVWTGLDGTAEYISRKNAESNFEKANREAWGRA